MVGSAFHTQQNLSQNKELATPRLYRSFTDTSNNHIKLCTEDFVVGEIAFFEAGIMRWTSYEGKFFKLCHQNSENLTVFVFSSKTQNKEFSSESIEIKIQNTNNSIVTFSGSSNANLLSQEITWKFN